MPERRDMPSDPIDKAYVQAEAVLEDAAARAARRTRVLAAVAAPPAADAAPTRRPRTWGRGGWLIAASVVGLSVLVAVRITPQGARAPSEAPPPAPAVTAPQASAPEALPQAAAPPTSLPPPTQALAKSAAAPAAADEIAANRAPAPSIAAPPPAAVLAAPAAPQTPPPAPPVAPAATPPPAPPPPAAQARLAQAFRPSPAAASAAGAIRSGELNELVVTGEKRQSVVERRADLVAGSDLDRAERLRTAAANGQTEDVAALLSGGVPVDGVDKDGETALMKAVQADQPQTAALLRRRGARLDRRNHAGLSVQDMAAKVADPALDEALRLKP